jgi:hypothetical protein
MKQADGNTWLFISVYLLKEVVKTLELLCMSGSVLDLCCVAVYGSRIR